MKRITATLAITLLLGTIADAGLRRCNAPIKFDRKGRITATCQRIIPKRFKGQRCDFSSCREHAITDCDCEWYEREAKIRAR